MSHTISAVLRPDTVEDAVAALAADADARPLSGGATLVAMMNARLATPSRLIALESIAELSGITTGADGSVRIGAMTRHRETAADSRLAGTLNVVRAAAGSIANPPVRNMGTMGGSIAFADPAADYPPALVAADASIEVAGPGGRRRIPAGEFFVDWYRTALTESEIVVAVHLRPQPGLGSYRKLARVAGDFAIASVALVVAQSSSTARVRVAIGGCGPVPIASAQANELLSADLADPASVDAAARILIARADPVDDVRGSADYRRRLIGRLLHSSVAGIRAEAQQRP